MHEAYAQALYNEAVGKTADEQNKLVDSLLRLLKKRGHEALIPNIFKSLTRIQSQTTDRNTVTLTLAAASHLKKFESAIAEDEQKFFGESAKKPTLRTDDSLVGGYILQKGDVRVDKSFKFELLTLFTKLTGSQS